MKKTCQASIFILFVSILFIFSSCGSAGTDDETLYYVSPSEIAYKNGMFRVADGIGMLEFLDFDSMVTAPICPKPNCSHTDPSTCSALGINGVRFIYDDKLWWFDNDTVYENGEIHVFSPLYSADVDGTNRVKVAVLDGMYVLSPSVYVKNGKTYFEARNFGRDNKSGNSTGYDKVYLYSYDFENKEFTELFAVKEGYHAEISIIGRYENSLALRITDGIENQLDLNPPRRYMFYDFDSGEYTECGKKIHLAQKDWLISSEDDGTIIVDRAYSDEKYSITDERFTQAFWKGYRIFDGMLMCTGDGYAYELKTGKVRTTQICSLHAYYKGKYIVSFMNSNEYIELTKKELFLD